MSVCAKSFRLVLSAIQVIILFILSASKSGAEVNLYTPYTRVSVAPGESVDYTVDLINNSGEIKNVDLSVSGLLAGWNYFMKAGGYNIGQMSVLPGERKNINFKVEVPMKVNKGSYRFRIVGGDLCVLPLTIVVTEQGTYKTEFTTTQANMEGIPTVAFTFQAKIRNRTADDQHYALAANLPPGWNIIFRANFKQATSVDISANGETDITIDIDPPDLIEAGAYKIPVRAVTSATSAELILEVVITGTYGMTLTTPTGLLSTNITAGDYKRIGLVVSNTGSAELRNIQLTSVAPVNWEVSYDPKTIGNLAPGGTAQVNATIKASRRSIPGDFVTNLEATTPEVTAKAAFRITVKTPLIWGWVGVMIILTALGSVYYLFRRYGRR